MPAPGIPEPATGRLDYRDFGGVVPHLPTLAQQHFDAALEEIDEEVRR
ncbi:hypothetical protein BH20ACT3_BH20ACT3_03700 [soil metagenome]